MADLETFLQIGDVLSSVNDNIKGQQAEGGRKTATEVRIAGEQSSNRLGAHAKHISAYSLTDLTEIMCLDTQQFLSEEFYVQIVGQEGHEKPIRVSPEQLVGDFYFPVSDGTLPFDKVALFDLWKDIFGVVQQDPVLRQQYAVGRIFEFIAELGGAKNIQQFKLEPGSPEQIAEQAGAGNLVPAGGGPQGGGPGQTQPNGPPPQQALQGGPPGGPIG